MRQRSRTFAIVLSSAVAALAFANAPIGSLIENVSLPTLAGGQRHLLGLTNVSVFIFIKPGLEHSRSALVQIAQCEKEMAGKPLYWSAIVSDRIPRTEAELEIKAVGLTMPVLIDKGDALYGKLGVILHPVVGITDKDQKLLAYTPFTKVNYGAVVRAQIGHALKEISDEELQQVLHPPAALNGGDAATARRRLKLAEKLFEAKNYEKALESVNVSIEKAPDLAAAHALRGDILAAQGLFSEALEAFESALKLDSQDVRALQGMKSCKEIIRNRN